MKCRLKIKRFFARIRESIKLFREYYGWYYPALKNLYTKRQQIAELRSAMFREDNKVQYAYYKGQIDLINGLLEEWHGKRNSEGK